jgi:hypothetical protein
MANYLSLQSPHLLNGMIEERESQGESIPLASRQSE